MASRDPQEIDWSYEGTESQRDLDAYDAMFQRQLADFNRAYVAQSADAEPGAHSRTELSAAQRSPGSGVDGA